MRLIGLSYSSSNVVVIVIVFLLLACQGLIFAMPPPSLPSLTQYFRWQERDDEEGRLHYQRPTEMAEEAKTVGMDEDRPAPGGRGVERVERGRTGRKDRAALREKGMLSACVFVCLCVYVYVWDLLARRGHML